MSRKMMFFTTFSAANWEGYARYTIPTWAKLNNQVVIFWDKSPVPDSLKEFISENPWARMQFIGEAAIDFQRLKFCAGSCFTRSSVWRSAITHAGLRFTMKSRR